MDKNFRKQFNCWFYCFFKHDGAVLRGYDDRMLRFNGNVLTLRSGHAVPIHIVAFRVS